MEKKTSTSTSTSTSSSSDQQEADNNNNNNKSPTQHHLSLPSNLNLTQEEFNHVKPSICLHHTYLVGPSQCSSLLAQRIHAPIHTVWSIVRRFDKPQTYKHFIKSCSLPHHVMSVGSTREVNVISGLPAATSTERLDILDDDRHVTGFTIVGGEHRLRNYRSVTTLHGFEGADGEIWTVVLESYVVDVPEGNTEEDARLFADTVVKLNLQKLASVTEAMNREGDGDGNVGKSQFGGK